MPPQNIISDQSSSKSSVGSIVALVVIFALLIAVSVYMYKSGTFAGKTPAQEQVATGPVSEEKVVVVSGNLDNGGPAQSKLPAAFPATTPVPEDAVFFESLTSDFPERGVTMSTFGYTTNSSDRYVYSLYEPFLTANGYTFDAQGKVENVSLNGMKDGDAMTVLISKRGESTAVNVTLVDRK